MVIRFQLRLYMERVAYVVFIIDAFARRIVGWRVSRTADARFIPDALEQALYQRQPTGKSDLVHS